MPKDEDVSLEDIVVGTNGFLKRIPQEIRATFTDQQIAAIEQAFPRTRHDVNIRVTLPLPWGRRYVLLCTGKEGRSRERLRLERLLNPLFTVKNVVTLAIIGFLVVFSALNIFMMTAS
jgi:hypothetical protein